LPGGDRLDARRPLAVLARLSPRAPLRAALAVAVTTPTTTLADPARGRGLRRTRALVPCPTVAPTPLPAPVEPVHLLALLTRVRAQRVAASQLAAARLHDVRAYKPAYAELG
jgi:hypothetical protein